MTQVFVRINYSILEMPELFKQLSKFIGHFQIQQTVDQSYKNVCELWFFTDKVEIEPGKSRQVEITVINKEPNVYEFEIEKHYP